MTQKTESGQFIYILDHMALVSKTTEATNKKVIEDLKRASKSFEVDIQINGKSLKDLFR